MLIKLGECSLGFGRNSQGWFIDLDCFHWPFVNNNYWLNETDVDGPMYQWHKPPGEGWHYVNNDHAITLYFNLKWPFMTCGQWY